MTNAKPALKNPILIVGNKESFASEVSKAIPAGYKVYSANTNKRVNSIIEKYSPSVILLNLDLNKTLQKEDDDNKFEILKNIERETPYSKIITISYTYNHQEALKSIQLGAYDYLAMPIDTQELEVIIRRACQTYNLEEEIRNLDKNGEKDNSYFDIVGRCKDIKEVFSIIQRVADTNSTVLISGKSGTGKELVAQAIHKQSKRRDKPFVAINCGAIPETLLESELFGHEKGSFTGASELRIGKLEAANHGTVFLDEIGELSILLQVKLLRFLQDRKIERVGSTKTIDINTRVLAATNKDINEEVKQERFREDLYFRLSVIPITLPPLKDRGEDILLLANYFLQRYQNESSHKILGFDKKLISMMFQYEWPGNIRELENRIRRGIIMSTKKYLLLEDLDFGMETPVKGISLQQVRMNAEKELISSYLLKNYGHISKTAEELQISRPTFHNLLKKLNINPKDYKRLKDNPFWAIPKDHTS